MIILAYYNSEKRLTVNINFDFDRLQYVITRHTAGDVWTERTQDKQKAQAIANNFINLTSEQLENRTRAGVSLAR